MSRISSIDFHTRGLNQLLNLQQSIAETQQQISTGKRLLNGADDPVGSSRLHVLKQELNNTSQYISNAQLASERLSFEENILKSVTNTLQQLRDLTIQSTSISLNSADRASMSKEVTERLNELQGLANSRNASGEYIFSGFQSHTKAFETNSNGDIIYQGDQGTRTMQVGASSHVATNDTGKNIFMDIAAPTGSVKTEFGSSNTGSLSINNLKVKDNEKWLESQPESYQIVFNALNPQANFDIEAVSNPGVPIAGFNDITYTPGMNIQVQGISLSLTGTPQPGDTLKIFEPNQQDIFSGISQLTHVLENSADTPEDKSVLNYHADLSLEHLDNALNNILTIRASVGTRLNVLDNQINLNEGFNVVTQSTISNIEEVDFAKAVSDLSVQSFSLELAQKSFAKLQGLSLFNYI